MGSTSRVRIHSQCRSPYRHPVTNSQNFSSPTKSNKLCRASKHPYWLGLYLSLKYSLADGKNLRRNDCILYHLSNQVWTLRANIIRGPTFRRHILSECVRPVHQLVFRIYYPLMTLSVVNPSIRMSWIINNWEKEWSDGAVDTIKELVSFVSFFF